MLFFYIIKYYFIIVKVCPDLTKNFLKIFEKARKFFVKKNFRRGGFQREEGPYEGCRAENWRSFREKVGAYGRSLDGNKNRHMRVLAREPKPSAGFGPMRLHFRDLKC